ncbi:MULTISPECIES: ScbA/BarX family gamma-butyrolactone biosynthesis protein [Streptomyces]|uniref:ScbA/BarX family gamma-butyrolactone biosynthesis protein n=1 Tax=Streptomyces TaxID=1883 RepID=UPI001E4CB8B7|nr:MULTISPECIES: ScbA/BarX family gamma-butyrolactone biosynthesis protein [Streptomyces]UFQ16205.1 gamma-butyrolactone biosynthesis enzyme [Streptomyces huasconensis]WCL85809.1 ScbA/BarX family gamma-butyrolactone biosynthesis protein [Streptomyces sp. JCM 35825]
MLTSAQAPRIDSAPATSPLLTTTVPRGYVHRASVAEVLLTGWDKDAHTPAETSDAYVVRAQWPRSHALFASAHGHQDPLLLVESIRQAGTLLTHTEYDVPFGHQFLMWDMYVEATPAAFATSPTPTDVDLHITCHDIVRRGRSIAGMRYEVTVRRDGLPVATGGARFSCTSPAVHRRLRGERPTTTGRALPAPLDPVDVGHTSRENVVLAPPVRVRENRWELRVDTGHPVFFDHPVDHVPGMLLIEAARQAARVATRQPDALLVGLRSTFVRYAELDAPCWIEAQVERAEKAEEVRVHVRGTQEGERVFTADLVLRRAAG